MARVGYSAGTTRFSENWGSNRLRWIAQTASGFGLRSAKRRPKNDRRPDSLSLSTPPCSINQPLKERTASPKKAAALTCLEPELHRQLVLPLRVDNSADDPRHPPALLNEARFGNVFPQHWRECRDLWDVFLRAHSDVSGLR